MFRPIKNFINYIQNASGNAIFGGVASTIEGDADTETKTEVAVVALEGIELESAHESMESLNTVESRSISKVIEHKIHMAAIDLKGVKRVNTTKMTAKALRESSILDLPTSANDYEDEDDIEMQIKRSIMIKQSHNNGGDSGTSVAGNNKPSASVVPKQLIVGRPPTHDHNQNDAELDEDELDGFCHDPLHSMSMLAADTSSVVSEGTAAGEETAEELVTEEEDGEETFLDMSNGVERFTGSEIVVLNDADLNSSVASIASDAPSEDPLAIDDFTQPSVLKETSNPLDSSTNDEGSTSADILWINIEDIKRSTITPNLQKDSCESAPTSTPQRQVVNGAKENRTNATINSDENAEELRSDGSDSGLGSETSALQTTLANVADAGQLDASTSSPTTKQTLTLDKSKLQTDVVVNVTNVANVATDADDAVTLPPVVPKPLRSNLKRRLEDDDVLDSPQNTDSTLIVVSQQKKQKRSINFENVQVYYFQRQQGFGCVPSAGGCTLGMGPRHVAVKTLTLAEHAAELRRAHRLQLQEINPRGSSSDDSEESEEDYLSEGSGSDLDAESNGFLQPVSPKQRRALLKAAGVRKIDASEKIECRDIRNSREVCGCSCVEFCDPETCACNQAGIKCQVDRAMFPCGCTRDACGNTVGRVEFNPTRVRTHFIHTIMRLEMENRQLQNPSSSSSLGYSLSATSTATAVAQTTTGTPLPTYALPNNYYNLQSQSNYSSGYASPAYTAEPSTNYYQHQSTHYAAVTTTEIHQTQSYQLDSLDAGLFSSTATATAAYSEMLPAYSGVAASGAVNTTYHNLNYSAISHTPISPFNSYHQTSTSGYIPQHEPPTPPTTYSSCAVPSLPPYGTATTTAASPQYQQSSSFALDTTAPSCLNIDDGGGGGVGVGVDVGGTTVSNAGGSNFITLSAPIASSTRISQINDLLQHNRNTTATLVAVSSQCAASASTLSPLNTTISADTSRKKEETYDLVTAETATEDVAPTVEPPSAMSQVWPEIDTVAVDKAAVAKPTEAESSPAEDGVIFGINAELADESNGEDTATTRVVTTAVDVISN